MNNKRNNGQYERSRPEGGFYSFTPYGRDNRNGEWINDVGRDSYMQNNGSFNGQYAGNRTPYGQGSGNRNPYGQNSGNFNGQYTGNRNPHIQGSGNFNGQYTGNRNPYGQNRGNTNGQYSDGRNSNRNDSGHTVNNNTQNRRTDSGRRQYDSYSNGNSNWNNEHYRNSVRTARTTTRVIVAPRRNRDEADAEFFDDTIGGVREQRRDKIDEFASNVLVKLRQNKRFQSFKRVMTVLVVSFAILFTVLLIIYKTLFVVNDITVSGNSKYTEEEIIASSGIENGVNLYSFSSKNTNAKISFLCPSVLLADFTRTPPNKINIGITEEADVYYIDIYGEYYMLSDTLRVTGRTTEEEAKEKGLVLIRLQNAAKAVSGSKIELESSRANRILDTVISALDNSDLKPDVTVIDLTEDFEIMIGIKDMYRLELGTQDNMKTKLELAEDALKSDTFSTGNKGYVYVDGTKITRVRVDNQLTFDK